MALEEFTTNELEYMLVAVFRPDVLRAELTKEEQASLYMKLTANMQASLEIPKP